MSEAERPLSPAAHAAALMVRLYQLTLAPGLHVASGPGNGYRFHPRGSCHARQPFFKQGFLGGCRLKLWRIMRCHLCNEGGYDPVPDLKSETKQGIAAPFKSNLDG